MKHESIECKSLVTDDCSCWYWKVKNISRFTSRYSTNPISDKECDVVGSHRESPWTAGLQQDPEISDEFPKGLCYN
jgi:hypothetical protein